MFIGKPICMIATIIIAITCGVATMDSKTSVKNKIFLWSLSITLVGIVSSL